MAKTGFILGIIGAVLQISFLVWYISLIGGSTLLALTTTGIAETKSTAVPAEVINGVLAINETGTYTLEGVKYEVTALSSTSNNGLVTLVVNGQVISDIKEGGVAFLVDGTRIGIGINNTDTVYFYLLRE